MRRFAPYPRLLPKLFLSYLLVMAIGIGGVVLSVQLLAPSIFERLLDRHMGGEQGMMHRGMTEALQRDTETVFRSTILESLVVATVAATIAALIVSLFVSRRITSPITNMSRVSQRIAAGEYHARANVNSHDEIGDLASSLNDMAEQLENTEMRRVHLIGSVAHEIRTPLSTLRGNLEGMIDGVIEPNTDILARLHDETGRIQRLVDDLQELSRVESGSLPLHIVPAPARRIIEQSIARFTPQFEAKGVSLRDDSPDALPDVLADEDRTLQVLANLLSNALRHTAAGGQVTVAVHAVDDAVQFEIRDNGSGVSPEHLPYIFDRFYRADAARSRNLGGSGIGLTITRALVEAQGGHIRAESPGPGQGTTMTFTLPRA